MNVVRGGRGEEFEGSPLRALQMHAPNNPAVCFTHAILINADPLDHAALSERVARLTREGRCRIPPSGIKLMNADANDVIPTVMQAIHPLDYVFTFADIEGIKEWPWRSVEALKSRGHQSVDLYMLFPIRQAIQRMMSFTPRHLERYAPRFDAFFGSSAWRNCVSTRQTNSQSTEFFRCLERLYLGKLEQIWGHAKVVREIKSVKERCLYKMLFASKNEVARNLVRWEEGGSDQFGLGF